MQNLITENMEKNNRTVQNLHDLWNGNYQTNPRKKMEEYITGTDPRAINVWSERDALLN